MAVIGELDSPRRILLRGWGWSCDPGEPVGSIWRNTYQHPGLGHFYWRDSRSGGISEQDSGFVTSSGIENWLKIKAGCWIWPINAYKL